MTSLEVTPVPVIDTEVLTDEEVNSLMYPDVVEDDPQELYEAGKLELSFVRKIATRGYGYQEISPEGHVKNRIVATDNNAFGLLAGTTCPGRTEFCKGCYAEESQIMPGVERKMRHNTEQLTNAESVEEMEDMLTAMVQSYYDGAMRRGTAPNDLIFRIHWDGDFFSRDYAQAWANTIKKFQTTDDKPGIRFLAFTRSFGYGENPVDVMEALSDVDNLALYLSIDEDNEVAGQAAYEKWLPVYGDRLKRAWCAEGYNFARELADKYDADIPARICPENNRALPLMMNKRDKGLRGACVVCRMCFNATRDVLFATTGKDNVSIQGSFDLPATEQAVTMKPTRRKPEEAATTEAVHPASIALQAALFDEAV